VADLIATLPTIAQFVGWGCSGGSQLINLIFVLRLLRLYR